MGQQLPAVFLRWHCAAKHTALAERTYLHRLRWGRAALPGGRRWLVPHWNVQPADLIAEHVNIQRDPTEKDFFFFNRHLRVGGRCHPAGLVKRLAPARGGAAARPAPGELAGLLVRPQVLSSMHIFMELL